MGTSTNKPENVHSEVCLVPLIAHCFLEMQVCWSRACPLVYQALASLDGPHKARSIGGEDRQPLAMSSKPWPRHHKGVFSLEHSILSWWPLSRPFFR